MHFGQFQDEDKTNILVSLRMFFSKLNSKAISFLVSLMDLRLAMLLFTQVSYHGLHAACLVLGACQSHARHAAA